MPRAAVRAADGVGCSWEGVQTLLWVSDKGVLATEVVQPVAQRFAFQVVLAQSSGRLFLPGPPEWFSFCPQATVGPQSVFAGGRARGKDSSADPCRSPGGGRPLPSTPASPPEGRAGAVWWLRLPQWLWVQVSAVQRRGRWWALRWTWGGMDRERGWPGRVRTVCILSPGQQR